MISKKKYSFWVVVLSFGIFNALLVSAEDKDIKSLALNLQQKIIQVSEKVIPAYVFIAGASGVLVSPDGYVLTNYHVVANSVKWDVFRADGKSYEAERIGCDPTGDIALLKIKDAKELPYLEFGDSDTLEVGQPVIVVGNPFTIGISDLEPTVTFGLISALHRFQNDYSDAIQTDAAINPGNSGGPLITLDGKIVGINGKLETEIGFIFANTGIGYAIPANQIKRFLPKLKTEGQVVHAEITGLRVEPIQATENSRSSIKVIEVVKN
ncbi:MAG: trypsin-like peptidase domain-containing protein [Planctomycetota bacterium]